MHRRVFLGAGLLLTGSTLAACTTDPGGSVPASTSATGPEPTAPSTASTPEAEASEASAPEGDPTASTARVLLAYFSRPGENYYYGDRTTLEVGNTQVVAEMIAASTDVDVFRIEAADPYPESYDATVDRNVQEEESDACPAIAGSLPDLAGYGTVLLGSPVWNVQTPMILRTFVESVDLAGRTLHPFVTFAVSGLGRVADDYARLCPESTIGEALAVQGEEAAQAGGDVTAWLQRIGLPITP